MTRETIKMIDPKPWVGFSAPCKFCTRRKMFQDSSVVSLTFACVSVASVHHHVSTVIDDARSCCCVDIAASACWHRVTCTTCSSVVNY